MPLRSDPSRTPLFYWLLALVLSIVISLSSYALLRLMIHSQAIIALETWRDLRAKDVIHETETVHQLQERAYRNEQAIAVLTTNLRELKNTVLFQEAQLAYLIEWDKRRYNDPLRTYPR